MLHTNLYAQVVLQKDLSHGKCWHFFILFSYLKTADFFYIDLFYLCKKKERLKACLITKSALCIHYYLNLKKAVNVIIK